MFCSKGEVAAVPAANELQDASLRRTATFVLLGKTEPFQS